MQNERPPHIGIVFALAAAGWILRGPLSSVTGLPISDTTVALVAALAMFAIPVDRSRGRFALDWEAARLLPWHVLLLFGGGLALAEGFRETGLAVWIGDAVGSIEISTLLLVALLVTVMVLLTEITSNIASAATLLPILAAMTVGFDLDPLLLTVPTTLAASMAFMMPVATAPNAIVMSHEELAIGDMVRAGLWLNLAGVVLCTAFTFLVLRPVFGL